MKNITVKDIVKATGGFLLCGELALCALYDRVSQPVAAHIAIKRRAHRLPADIPGDRIVLDIEIMSVHVERIFVVAIARQASQTGIAVE